MKSSKKQTQVKVETKEKYIESNCEKMAICIQCQGIGYIKKNQRDYMKCTMCCGEIYIAKKRVARVLGTN